MALSKRIALIQDYAAEAEILRKSYGSTDLFTTGAQGLDAYLGGGFGRPHGYEMVVVFGPPKIGKSTLAFNLLHGAIEQNKKVGIMNLEEDGADVYLRLEKILGAEAAKAYMSGGEHIYMMPEEAMRKFWSSQEVIEYVEHMFVGLGCDLVLLDHLQFIFENMEDLKAGNEYARQRMFMRQLNGVMRQVKKTIIIISHVNKDSQAKGMNRIVGSSGISGAATKNLEFFKKDDRLFVQEHGARFVPTPNEPHEVMFEGPILRDAQYGVSFE